MITKLFLVMLVALTFSLSTLYADEPTTAAPTGAAPTTQVTPGQDQAASAPKADREPARRRHKKKKKHHHPH